MGSLRRSDDVMVRCGRSTRALLDQAVEQLSPNRRMPAVESEGVLIEVVFELIRRCAPLEGAEQPPFEQCRDAMNSWKLDAPRPGQPAVPIPHIFEPAISPLAVADDPGAFSNVLLHEFNDSGTLVVWNLGDPDATSSCPADFGGDYHDIFCFPRMIPRAQAADQRLINLDVAGKLFTSWPDHGSTQFMQHGPRCLITGQPEQSLEPHCTDSHFLVGHPPYGSIPQPQGNLASMKDGSSRDRQVCIATMATENPLLGTPRLSRLAPRTEKSFGPSNPFEVIPA